MLLHIHEVGTKNIASRFTNTDYEMITHPEGCIWCSPGKCWGCCTTGGGCCPCDGWWEANSWPGGIITCGRGTPGGTGGPPLLCIATGGPATPIWWIPTSRVWGTFW